MNWATIRDSDKCSRHAGASGLVHIILVWGILSLKINSVLPGPKEKDRYAHFESK